MYFYFDSSWTDASLDEAHVSGASLSSLYVYRSLLEDQLGLAEGELEGRSSWTPEFLTAAAEDSTLWLWFGDGSQFASSAFLHAPVASGCRTRSPWQSLWIRSEGLRERIRLLRQRLRLLSFVIGLLLKKLACSRFLCQLVGRERGWSLLHGAHPPRRDAGLSRPKLAEPGRVCCEYVR